MNEESKLKTYRGVWEKRGKFIKEDSEVIKIAPYAPILREFYDQLPIECYILLKGNAVKEVVKIG